jgi:hypothetical protein
MKLTEIEALKADFLEWTGGFNPETDEDIEVYIETSMPLDIDDDEARDILRNWMCEAEAVHPPT